MTTTTTTDHVVEEETKIEVDCEEPTDERDMKNDTATPAAVTTIKTTTMDAASEGAAVTNDDNKSGDAVVQPPSQIQMTVAADAPWKDRVWEGTLCV
jgi:hypothetical protein